MADYTSSYTGSQIDALLGRISTAEGNITSLSSTVSNLDSAVGNKVDKVPGKALSSNDYTTAEKNKLAGVATGAESNVLESVKVGGTALTITNKAVNIELVTTADIDALFA